MKPMPHKRGYQYDYTFGFYRRDIKNPRRWIFQYIPQHTLYLWDFAHCMCGHEFKDHEGHWMDEDHERCRHCECQRFDWDDDWDDNEDRG